MNVNVDSVPNYGKRYRADQPISTAWIQSTVSEGHCHADGREAADALEQVHRSAVSHGADPRPERYA